MGSEMCIRDRFSLGNNLHVKDNTKEVHNIKKTANKKENYPESTIHQNPNWLADLKTNFTTEIISVCSARTKSAVENNENIEDSRENDRVRNEILSNLMDKLMNIFGCEGKPGMKAFRDLTVQLSYEYPEMFRNREPSQGRRGIDKIDKQARKMSDRFREKQRREVARNVKI